MSTLNINDIKKHADVIASCGTKVGTVDHLEGENQLKLTKTKMINITLFLLLGLVK